MRVKTTRMIFAEDLRHKCISEMWYTRGTNEAYSRMLGLCDTELTDKLLLELIMDIYHHSNWDKYEYGVKEIYNHIAWIIVNEVARYSTEIEEV